MSTWEDDHVVAADGRVLPLRSTARRPTWETLPAAVRDRIEHEVGNRVVAAISAGSGFTPGFASRLTLADGSAVFVKAASSAYDAVHGWDLTGTYREEARKLSLLDADFHAPALRWTLDEDIVGERWMVLGLQAVDGRPPRRPWQPDELDLVLETLVAIAPLMATPPAGLVSSTFAEEFGDWSTWLETVRQRDDASRWLDVVGELAAESMERCAGSGMAHLDFRDDNLLIDRGQRVWICDWNFPVFAAPWLDLVCVLIAAHGDGLDVDRIIGRHPLSATVPTRSIEALLANLWLYFTTRKDDPVPAHSPHLRDHQAWYADTTERWLRSRIGVAR